MTTVLSPSVREHLSAALASQSVDALRVAEDMFGVVDILSGHASVSRALTDPSRSDTDKHRLVNDAFGRHITETARDFLCRLSDEHWSHPDDFILALEHAGIDAVLVAAQRDEALERVEHELIAVVDLLRANRELRIQLSDLNGDSSAARADLAQRIFSAHLDERTMRLLRRSVGRSPHGHLVHTLRDLASEAARLRQRTLVSVESATELTPAQYERLAAIMARRVGRDVSIAVTVNPALVGGLKMSVGTEAVDASLATRIAQLRRTLAGESGSASTPRK